MYYFDDFVTERQNYLSANDENVSTRELAMLASLVYEDVPNGLVPIEYIGKQLNVKTKCITNIIDLADGVYNSDFRKIGRQFSIRIIKQYF